MLLSFEPDFERPNILSDEMLQLISGVAEAHYKHNQNCSVDELIGGILCGALAIEFDRAPLPESGRVRCRARIIANLDNWKPDGKPS